MVVVCWWWYASDHQYGGQKNQFSTATSDVQQPPSSSDVNVTKSSRQQQLATHNTRRLKSYVIGSLSTVSYRRSKTKVFSLMEIFGKFPVLKSVNLTKQTGIMLGSQLVSLQYIMLHHLVLL